ncbi:choice-of-anchor tandem repeat GloVer-containing protein [Ekhidna sp.]|uniref:choice-of-anchor tandem repeat GloVer-containing protein n=1 Tax=Ekhidna sp. TaxID=2608089 RepID=UPI003C7E41FE
MKLTKTCYILLLLLFCIDVKSQTKLIGLGRASGGTIYSIENDGSNPQVLKDFHEKYPRSNFVIKDDVMFGIGDGGAYNRGIVYSINPDGTNLVVLHTFSESDGGDPIGTLALQGNTLWGVTARGGENNHGVIFNINVDGSDFEVVHHFDGTNGSEPRGGLCAHDGKFFGMTRVGGANNFGTLYEISFTGNFLKRLDFNITNGRDPYGRLIENGGFIWGMTRIGGANNQGLIFAFNPTSSAFFNMHDFETETGRNPHGGLTISNSRFWGTTVSGGTNDLGTIFSLALDGSDYQKEHDCELTTGISPQGDLVETNGKLWGTAIGGGTTSQGTLFNLNVDGTGFQKIHDFTTSPSINPFPNLVVLNNEIIGITAQTLFKIDDDNTGFQTLRIFDKSEGFQINGSITLSNNKLWGMTQLGGEQNHGVIFRMDLDGSNFEVVHDYINASNALSKLIESNGKLWGMAAGGTNNHGIIFSIDLDGTNFMKVHDFDNTNGSYLPGNSLIESDGKLIGTAGGGASFDDPLGVLFTINTDGTGFTKIRDFDFLTGGFSYGSLCEANNKLWGTTHVGGANNNGVIFCTNLDGTGYNKVHDFNGTNGSRPFSGLTLVNGKLFGVTYSGGTSNVGTIYSINTDGTGFSKIHDFDGSIGNGLYGGLVESNDKLWGLMTFGGSNEAGIIFSINPDGTEFTKEEDLSAEFGGYPEFTTLLEVITKQDQNISFTLYNKTYGDPSFDPGATSNSPNEITYESSDPSIISITNSTATIESIGQVTITATQAEDEAYIEGSSEQTIDVLPADLTASAVSETIAYGDEPSLDIDYSGFVYGETELDITPPIATASYNGVGEFPIVLMGGSADNYNLINVDGTLTVSKADQTISFEPLPIGLTEDSPAFSLSATATSGLGVTFNADDPTIVSISGSVVNILNDGEVVITASQVGNENYNAAPNEIQALSIGSILSILDGRESFSGIHPNPASSTFSLILDQPIISLYLIDLNGRIVKNYVQNDEKKYDVSNVESGVYFLLVETESDGIFGGKVIIIH